ncbi:unannotated protein [freshwater metagenome]|uniref:Unannotated protein n=1 Tax=freshwater metagenome TaxID=449393 RepID=A0A6J6ERC6_9ZZZZ
MFAPMRPASTKVSGLPAVVTHTGSSGCTGRGSVVMCSSAPSTPTKVTVSPRHSAFTFSMSRNITFLASA